MYDFIEPAINKVTQGFNCSIFAYGQTGSGKTYTMFGPNFSGDFGAEPNEGMIPRAISQIFKQVDNLYKSKMKEFTVYCSFVQIYNEKLYDLLQDGKTENPLNIREDKYAGIFVEGCSEYVITNPNDCLYLLQRGEFNRITRQTKSNVASSRSHSLFQL